MSDPGSPDQARPLRRQAWLRTLPWIVGLSTGITLLPLCAVVRSEIAGLLWAGAVAHSPTFLVLFGLSVGVARDARRGQRVSPSVVGGIVGALLGATGLMIGVLVPAFVHGDWWALFLYFSLTLLLLPLVTLAGAGLGTATVALVRRRRPTAT